MKTYPVTRAMVLAALRQRYGRDDARVTRDGALQVRRMFHWASIGSLQSADTLRRCLVGLEVACWGQRLQVADVVESEHGAPRLVAREAGRGAP